MCGDRSRQSTVLALQSRFTLPFVGMMMVYWDVPRWLFELFVSGGGIAVALSVLLFFINVFKYVR